MTVYTFLLSPDSEYENHCSPICGKRIENITDGEHRRFAMTRKTIVVDIDNTIVDQSSRKLAILRSMNRQTITADELQHDFHLTSLFKEDSIARATFFGKLLGPDFQDSLTAMPQAVEALNQLKDKHRIIYLTSRPESQKDITSQLIVRLGFPGVNEDDVKIEMWPLECEIDDLSYEQSCREALDWKKCLISRYASDNEILVGIDDMPENVSIFANLGIPSILFASHGTREQLCEELKAGIENRLVRDSVLIIDNWKDAHTAIEGLDSAEDTLKELVGVHTTEYVSFLGDLDAKARLLLMTASFLGTAFLGIIWKMAPTVGRYSNKVPDVCSWILLVLSSIGVFLCSSSIIFSIRSFASRHTRGHGLGKPITVTEVSKFLKHTLLMFIGRPICPTESPIEDAMLARTAQGKPQQRLAHLGFFQRNYGTYDPELIRNQRMLDMRALNYEKIYPEAYARRTLMLSLCLIFVCLILLMILVYFQAGTRELPIFGGTD